MHPLPVPTSTISGPRVLLDALERLLDDELGLGPRNQDVRTDLEVQPPELPRAEDVGDRLAPLAPATTCS